MEKTAWNVGIFTEYNSVPIFGRINANWSKRISPSTPWIAHFISLTTMLNETMRMNTGHANPVHSGARHSEDLCHEAG